jgi:hypothetical protein
MGMNPEILLKAFVLHDSKDAFFDLVASTVDEVYSIAVRLVDGPPHLVEETVLRVYWELARKAPRLPEDLLVAVWLREHTCKTAVAILRAEDRSVDRAALKNERQETSNASNVRAAPPGLAIRISHSIWLNVGRKKSLWYFLLRFLWPAWVRPVHIGVGIVCVLGIFMLWKLPFHRRNPVVQDSELQMTPASFGQLANAEDGVVPAAPEQPRKQNPESRQNKQ